MSVQNSGRKEKYLPHNEDGVFYLFSRNHEECGFKKIVDITGGTPDIIAINDDGEEVGIELEYKASTAFDHYCALDKKEQSSTVREYPRGEWNKDGSIWKYVYDGKTLMRKEDPTCDLFKVDVSRKFLLYKTVKSIKIDVIMYWLEDHAFEFWEWDKKVKCFDLKKKLSEIGKSSHLQRTLDPTF